jgi:xylulokinase
MMKRGFLIGIDAGTTSVKGILVRTSGQIVCSATREYSLEYPAPDLCELDSEVYWQSTLYVIRTLLRKSKIEPGRVLALAISSQGETLIPIDHEGRPLRKAIVWLDNRSVQEANEIKNSFSAQTLFRKTGLPEIVAMWPATRILWLKKHEPEIFARTAKFLLVEDFLIHRLTGCFAANESMASSTLLFDIVNKQWWPDMLNFLSIRAEQLPSVVPSGEKIAYIQNQVARTTGLPESVAVVSGAYDHAAGAIGCGNLREGIVSETTGASMAMVVTLDKPLTDAGLNLPCQCHAVPGKYFILPYGQTAGMVLKWFKDAFAQQEIRQAKAKGEDVYCLLDGMAAKVPIGCDGLIMLPHLMGAGSPEFDEKIKGAYCGITPAMGKGHFVRAILESVAYMIMNNLQVLRSAGIAIEEIRALGGGARSHLWNQINADCTGIPFVTFRSSEPTSMGAALLAGVGSGVYENIEEGCDIMVRVNRRFEPEPNATAAYAKVFSQYQKLYKALAPFWR